VDACAVTLLRCSSPARSLPSSGAPRSLPLTTRHRFLALPDPEISRILLLRAGCEQVNERGLADQAGEVTNGVAWIPWRLVAKGGETLRPRRLTGSRRFAMIRRAW